MANRASHCATVRSANASSASGSAAVPRSQRCDRHCWGVKHRDAGCSEHRPLRRTGLAAGIRGAAIARAMGQCRGEQLGAAARMIGGLLLAVRALDAVVDPWLGRVMDRVCGRAGVACRCCRYIARCGGFCRAVLRRRRLSLGETGFTMAWPRQPWHLPIWATAPRRSCIKRGRSLGGDAAARTDRGWARGVCGGRGVGDGAAGHHGLARVKRTTCRAGGNCIGRAAWRAHASIRSVDAAGSGCRRDCRPHKVVVASAGVSSPMLVYVISGFAAAIPANLVVFYIRDRLQAGTWEPAFLSPTLLPRRSRCHCGRALPVVTDWCAAGPAAWPWQPPVCWRGLARHRSGVAVPCRLHRQRHRAGSRADCSGRAACRVLQRSGGGYGGEGAWFGWWTLPANSTSHSRPVWRCRWWPPGYTPGAREAQPCRRWRWFMACCPAW